MPEGRQVPCPLVSCLHVRAGSCTAVPRGMCPLALAALKRVQQACMVIYWQWWFWGTHMSASEAWKLSIKHACCHLLQGFTATRPVELD
jgi:hypothetical protein